MAGCSSGLEFLSLHPFVRATVVDKLRGAILGAALGDCIGLYTEFLSKEQSYGAYPLGKFQLVEPTTPFNNDSHRNRFTRKSWTDDTDHALLIVLSYLHNDGKLIPNDLAARLLVWVEQGLRCLDKLPLGLGGTVGKVVLNKGYLSDPPQTTYKCWVADGCYAAPNGSLMRTHPLGVICVTRTVEETFQVATEFSLVTHADPRCVVACCISTGLIRGILRGEVQTEADVDTLVERAFGWVDAWQRRGRKYDVENSTENEWEDVSALIKDGKGDAEGSLSTVKQEQPSAEPALDQEELYRHTKAKDFNELELDDSMKMGYVYKSLGVAILALRRAMHESQRSLVYRPAGRDYASTSRNIFEHLITTIVMEGGDADTNASIAGALLGSWLGHAALPLHWVDGIEHRDWLLQKCDALSQTVGITRGLSNRPAYRGSEDPDTRPDGGKGLLSKEALDARWKTFITMYMMKQAERKEQDKRKAGWKWKSLSK